MKKDSTRVEYWLEVFDELMAPHFARAEPRRRASSYVRGLIATDRGERKNVAAYTDERRADGAQRLLTSARWDEDGVRAAVSDLVTEQFGATAQSLYVMEGAFVKKGAAAVGVERQYSVETSRVENCQLAILLFRFAPRTAPILLDTELYLPPSWAADHERRRKAGVPPEVAYRTKSRIAAEMTQRAVRSGTLPASALFSLLCPDKDVLRRRLQEMDVPYLLPLTAREHDPNASNGVRTLAARHVPDPVRRPDGRPQIVRTPASSNGPCGARWWEAPYGRAAQMVLDLRRLNARWRCLRTEVNVDRYEVRSWQGWRRHMTLVMVADAAQGIARLHAARSAPASPVPALGSPASAYAG